MKKEQTNENLVQKTEGLSNSKYKDSSGKIIFENPILFSQFLRDYIPVSLLAEVKPEDIEDVTERYVHMFVEERNSDVVKRVYLKGNDMPFYLISLLEHKSTVDYNVAMQMLRYMVYIWEDYEKEKEQEHYGISKTKGFRYPPVLPIIYYTGKQEWSASVELADRIWISDVLAEYIPGFKCILVQLKDYSNLELMEKRDELSILMMINKFQETADFMNWKNEIGTEYLSKITKQTPEYLLGIMAHVVEMLLLKINVPKDEAESVAETIKERNMAGLFDHFEDIDIQVERKKNKQEREANEKEREANEKEREANEKEREAIEQEREEMNREREEMNQEREEMNQEREEMNQEREVLEEERGVLKKEKLQICQSYIELYREMGLLKDVMKEKLLWKFPDLELDIDKYINDKLQ